MIIVIIGNSNNDNDNGRFYARDVKVVSSIKTANDNESNITVAVKVIVHDRDSDCWNGKELLMI